MKDIVDLLKDAAYVMYKSGWQSSTIAGEAAAEIIRLRSELSKAQPKWQPIATAPMDGTEILGFGSASWRGKKYSPAHHIAWFADGKWLGRDPDADVELHLTEWTPLLAAPKRLAQQEGEQR